MKLWWRNINPPIIGYGTVNAIPNLSPGKYTQISNPNAKVEAFEVNTNALMMFGQTSQQNAANMVQLLGAADQQMAAQNTGGMMSQTPQGVEAQQQMVDITTNNYQKAMENFFSKYCSYALTIYFQELKGVKTVTPSADARKELIDTGMNPEIFIHEEWTEVVEDEDPITGETVKRKVTHPSDGSGLKDGTIKVDFSEMATLYHVQCVPGSLTELEDEKQIRILNELFIPLSQAMPAIANSGDQEAMKKATSAMMYIVQKQMELSGSSHSTELAQLFKEGPTPESEARDKKVSDLELALGGAYSELAESADFEAGAALQMRADLNLVMQNQAKLLAALGLGEGGGQPAASGPMGPAQGAPAPAPEPAPVY
jgi:hypothetical protein